MKKSYKWSPINGMKKRVKSVLEKLGLNKKPKTKPKPKVNPKAKVKVKPTPKAKRKPVKHTDAARTLQKFAKNAKRK